LIVYVSAIFLLLVLEKSAIFSDFRAIALRISAREGGMAPTRTDDDSVTYWFLWKHPKARRRGLEFGVFDQTPLKWSRRLGPTGLAARSSFLHKTTIAKASARPFGPHHLPLSAPLHENTTQMWAQPCGPRHWSVANAPGANFSPFRCLPRGLAHEALDSDHADSECSHVGAVKKITNSMC